MISRLFSLKILLLFVYIMTSINSFSQNKKENETISHKDTLKNVNTGIMTFIEQMPEFPGGLTKLEKFIKKNMQYPQDAIENDIYGKVYVHFVVTKNGDIINPTVVKPIHPSLDNEALRLISIMPKWKPGKDKGELADVDMSYCIRFERKKNK